MGIISRNYKFEQEEIDVYYTINKILSQSILTKKTFNLSIIFHGIVSIINSLLRMRIIKLNLK